MREGYERVTRECDRFNFSYFFPSRLLKSFSAGLMRPQRLKPAMICFDYGAAEAAPFQNGPGTELFITLLVTKHDPHQVQQNLTAEAAVATCYFFPSRRMREVKARPSQAVKVAWGWVESMTLSTTKGLQRPVMLSKPPRKAR